MSPPDHSLGRILALDLGSRRIGVAVSDELGVLATPRGAITRQSEAQVLAEIRQLVQQEAAAQVVVGHPLSMSGRPTAETRRAEAFRDRLLGELRVPVVLWDERLTTVAATAITGQDPRSRRSGRRDAVAAALLLQNYLDSRRASSAG